MTQLGSYIQELRQAAQLGINATGRQAGCSGSYVSQLERGDRVSCSPDLLIAIVQQALGGNLMRAAFEMYQDAGVPENVLRREIAALAQSLLAE